MFEDPASAKIQIRRDKHSLLEGYVTEYLYERQFLSQSPERYTHGWWAAENFDQRFFFVVTEALNDVDCAIMRKLSKQHSCWRVYSQGNAWYFKHGDCRLTMEQFLGKYKLPARNVAMAAAPQVCDPERQDRCIDFFESHQLLQKIATERYFVNDFLSVYFGSLVNIDFFKQTDSKQLKAIEVKFKFEAGINKFGINQGQYNLFKQLEQLGIPVEHWILYNGTHDSRLSIFGFLQENTEKYWLSGYIHTNEEREEKTAPAETSVYGKRTQGYYEFDRDEFPDRTPLIIPSDM